MKLLEGSPKPGSPIVWTNDRELAMQQLKAAFTSADLLIHPTPWRLFVIDTDASGDCGAVLQQTGTPFAVPKKGPYIVSVLSSPAVHEGEADFDRGLVAGVGSQGPFRAIEEADEDTEGDEEHLEVEEDEGARSKQAHYKPARENVSANTAVGLNLVAPMPKPEPRRDPESPLEAFAVNNPTLPVYLGPPKAMIPNDAASSLV
ncbi:hypothetical protein EDB92DRAFT_1946397 [Lactarius akahatsu]|uniref:Reverse transcriptase/retrotransposon-derived protein RNase H-like domain-containing protein n=1 Tax=Lactarius akahatsu TaxID=416441 RepID=A0AAD4LJL2_9AGAM|nr:hypothetical protein EDB92DRAFT_1946397 [Lactarius akahatsu]